jgi:phenylacetate-CoA ligase
MHPVAVNKFIFPLQEMIKRKPTYRFLAELGRSQWFSSEELRALQWRRLKRQLENAGREVPYFRGLFNVYDIRPAEIVSLRDFQRIPLLDKETIRREADALRPVHRTAGTQRMSTGGSTGAPVSVFVDRERAAFTDAVRMRAHRWFDAGTGAREIALWGSPIELGRQGWVRDWRDRLVNSRFLPAFNMGEKQMAEYSEFIRSYRPVKMYGYASAFYLLAEYLKTKNWRAPAELKVIFATAEPLYDFQRRLVEEVFHCPVAMEYGARDAGLLANECPQGGLHIPAEGILIEIDTPDPSGLGEIIVTNLYSEAMPMIRYRTGDMGRLLDGVCGCGRALPRLESVEGRRTDFLITPSGRVLHALAIIYPLRETASIKQFQVTQESVDRVTIRVVPAESFSGEEQQRLVRKANDVFGGGVDIVVERVAAIAPAASGKYRYVISNVAADFIKDMSESEQRSAAL